MRPHTLTLPKVLLPVCGHPFADWQLRWMKAGGVQKAVYCIGHLGAQVRDFIGDGSRWGIQVTYSDEGEELRGTGGALRLALDRGLLEHTFALTYGDSFLRLRAAEAFRAFEEARGALALMVVFRNAGRFDTSNVDFDGVWVRRYVPSPLAPPNALEYIDYGLSVLSREVVRRIPAAEHADMTDVFASMSVRQELAGLEVADRFFEIGSPTGREALELWLRRGPSMNEEEWLP